MNTEFNVGDTVKVKPYMAETLSGLKVEGYLSNKTGIVLGFTRDYSWRTHPNMAQIRVVHNDEAWNTSVALSQLEMVALGPGYFKLGETHPFSEKELQEQRWQEFLAKVNAISLEHEGFSNAGTFLAWMYLNQEPKARCQLESFVRKDGTINPNKVEKLFYDMKLTLDSWAFECPIALPSEFTYYRNPVAQKQAVNWQEVARQFEPEKVV